MKHKTKIISTAAAVAALGGAGAAIAASGGDDDATERPVTGSALQEASAAALDHTGGGRVSATEAGDEEGAYEIEVTRDDGSQVDVHLDEQFNVIGTKADSEDDDGAGED